MHFIRGFEYIMEKNNKCRVEFFLLGNGVESGGKYAWNGMSDIRHISRLH